MGILFRQRKIWLPTLPGLMLLTVVTGLLLLLVARHVYPFLAQNAPIGAPTLVVEGWLDPQELDQAVQLVQRGNYIRIITTGGPTDGWPRTRYTNYAEMSAAYLADRGIARDRILAVPSPATTRERTFVSALALRQSAQRLGINLQNIDILSSGAHARRTRLLFQAGLGSASQHIGILATRPVDFNPDNWWRTSAGVESVFFQTTGLIWTSCCFWPGR